MHKAEKRICATSDHHKALSPVAEAHEAPKSGPSPIGPSERCDKV